MRDYYILIALITLAAIAVIFIFTWAKGKKPKKPTKLAAFAMLLVALGIVFGDESRWLGYTYLGAGVTLAVVDLVRSIRKESGEL